MLLVLLGHAVAAREELATSPFFAGFGGSAWSGLGLLDEVHRQLGLAEDLGVGDVRVAACGRRSSDRRVVVGGCRLAAILRVTNDVTRLAPRDLRGLGARLDPATRPRMLEHFQLLLHEWIAAVRTHGTTVSLVVVGRVNNGGVLPWEPSTVVEVLETI